MEKKISDGVGFARKEAYEYEGKNYEADIQTGDTVTILNEGTVEDGQYGKQHNFKIETRNGEKKQSFNQKTINILIDEFGEDSKDWVGKEVTVLTKKDVIAGKRVIIAYLVTEGWQFDDFGELVQFNPTEERVAMDLAEAGETE